MKQAQTNNRFLFLAFCVAACLMSLRMYAESEQGFAPILIQRFEAADSDGVQASRGQKAVYLEVAAGVNGPIKIPRLCAPLRSMKWQDSDAEDGVSLMPEKDHWMIGWKNRPAGVGTLVLAFEAEPLLPSEVKPVASAADGSFVLPAHLATTQGEKIRYEPQPHKNTVGFWAGKHDTAAWAFKLDKPGRFNLAVLQGCGKGQGGSTAMVVVSKREGKPGEAVHEFNPVQAILEFDVIETGHWQNFQWRHLGVIELQSTGELYLTVMPKEIKKAALMDIRAIHLIRLPDKKK